MMLTSLLILLKNTVFECEASLLSECVCALGSVLSDSLWPQEPHPTRLLCPCDFPSRNTGADCHFLLQGNLAEPGMQIGLLCLLHFRRILYGWASLLSRWIFLVMWIKNSITGKSIGINEGILSAKILWFLYFSHRCEILIDVQISLLFVFLVKHFQVTVSFSFDILVFNFSFWNNTESWEVAKIVQSGPKFLSPSFSVCNYGTISKSEKLTLLQYAMSGIPSFFCYFHNILGWFFTVVKYKWTKITLSWIVQLSSVKYIQCCKTITTICFPYFFFIPNRSSVPMKD